MLSKIVTLSIGFVSLAIVGCEEVDIMAGNPAPPESAKSADWNAYRNCRERLQYAKQMGEISADRLQERIKSECENGFTPSPVDAGGPAITQGAGTR
jgi:hypothetical protein